MVAYVLADQADEYRSLEHDGLGAATDPDSLFGRFARPAIVLFAAWLLVENLVGS